MSQVQLVINWRRRVPSGIFKIIANEMLKEEINTDNTRFMFLIVSLHPCF